jgi:alkylhydroperoxidase/carboxymuconolactone decarboxylase family protein YurZ
MAEQDNTRNARQVLEQMHAKRGYLLPYHRLLGESDPALLATYDELYTRLTLNQRSLTPEEREIVWAALLATTRESSGAFHLDRGLEAGMTKESISDSMAIGAACEAFDALRFSHSAFSGWISEEQAMKRYAVLFEAARGSIPEAIAEVAAVVCHAARRNAAGMRIHLARGFGFGVKRQQMAEGLSYVLLHRGGPTMIDASACWEQVATELGIPGPY